MEYADQYINAGYPPKICSSMVSKLSPDERQTIKVLDVGCGKGEVGKYLKEVGFHHTTGLDCSKSLLSIAKAKGNYDHVTHFVFGHHQIPDSMRGKFDYVCCASLINNSDVSPTVLSSLIDCLKVGGHAIFTSKLDWHSKDIYEPLIKKLEADGFWCFTSEHQFNRYDKYTENRGKFSRKMIKVLSYQKIDHEQWVIETEKARI